MRVIRREQKLTSKQLSQLSGVTQSTISEIENDNRSPQIDTLEKICNALNIKVHHLFPAEEFLAESYSLTQDEIKMIKIFYKLNEKQRQELTGLLSSLLRQPGVEIEF